MCDQQRFDVRFTGRVQGVFFRATAEKIAREYAVGGWVANEPDGSVRMVAEGEPQEVERFLDALRGAKRDNISDVNITRSDATGGFDSFTIRY